MLFNSLEFIFLFFPVLAALYYLTRHHVSHDAALLVLTLGSLVFYAYWDVDNLPILLASAVGNYVAGVAITRWRHKALLIAAIVANLLLLGSFKYAAFVAGMFDIHIAERAIPLGISFFTFQQISFLVDVWAGRTRPRGVVPHILFVSFFPHLIAGPLVQHHQISNQFGDKTRRDDFADNFGVGISIFVIGMAKKVLLADNLEPIAAGLFSRADAGGDLALIESWLGVVAYSLQIFFDFSGYSDMALGLARCFGYHLPINFNAPYRSASIIEFWRRWHISLSQFLRDHLYIPLGGNRLGRFRRYLNLFMTMLLGGLWHGAGWTFVVWGALHGLMLAAAHLWHDAKLPHLSGIVGRPVMILATFVFVCIAWVFFRASSFQAAGDIIAAMFGAGGLGAWPPHFDAALVLLGLAIVWGLPDTATAFYRHLDPVMIATAKLDPPATRLQWRPAKPVAVALSILLVASILSAAKVAPFIYFAF
jgi:alginate O-acetyltransferase complex protein AlgI